MKINAQQTYLLERLKSLFTIFLSSKTSFFYKKNQGALGAYIYGNVGSGKTLIMQRFCHNIAKTGQFVHYQQLIKSIHEHNAQLGSRSSQPLALFAKKYYKNVKLLCIDEIEIKDPADASLIYSLLNILKNHTFIVFSSNFHPDDFIKNVLNFDLIMPLIKLLTVNFDILLLASEQDYRRINASKSSRRIIFPNNATNQDEFLQNIIKLTNHYPRYTAVLENFGRKIIFSEAYGPILRSNFTQLCLENLSYSDYIAICQKFDVIIIGDIPILNSNDVVTRFINLIDSIYFYRKALFAIMADSPERLYTQKLRELEFNRAVSRIIEINSESYQDITTLL
jgi:cell division protein ZapE